VSHLSPSLHKDIVLFKDRKVACLSPSWRELKIRGRSSNAYCIGISVFLGFDYVVDEILRESSRSGKADKFEIHRHIYDLNVEIQSESVNQNTIGHFPGISISAQVVAQIALAKPLSLLGRAPVTAQIDSNWISLSSRTLHTSHSPYLATYTSQG
jgi:hypothetical protein